MFSINKTNAPAGGLEVLIHPGLIVPEGRIIEKDRWGFFVKLELKCFGQSEEGVLYSDHIQGGLDGIKKLSNAQINTNQVVVVGEKVTNGKKIYEVAIDNYFNDLRCYFEDYFWGKPCRLYAWEKDCQDCYNYCCGQGVWLIDRGNKWIEVKGKYCVAIYKKSTFIKFLQGNEKFSPISFYHQEVYPCTYKTEDFVDLPIKYQATLELDDRTKRSVKICLHGFTNPAKWHYDVWKHLVEDSMTNSNYAKVWKVNPEEYHSFFEKCKKYKKNKYEHCDKNYCLQENLFDQVHPNIKKLCETYLKRIVTFWESTATKDIKIISDNPFNPMLPPVHLEVICYANRNIIVSGRLVPSHREWLILRGWSYDYADNNEATFHLNIITFYFGPYGKTKKQRGIEKFDDYYIAHGELRDVRRLGETGKTCT